MGRRTVEGLTYTDGIARDSRGRYHVRVVVAGRVIKRSLPTRREALALVTALRSERLASELGLVIDAAAPPLGELVDEYIAGVTALGRSPVTLEDYRKVGDRLTDHFGARHSARFTPADIVGYVRSRRARGAGARLIARELKLLKTFLKHTVGQAYLTWEVPRILDRDQAAKRAVPADADVAAVITALAPRPDVRRAALLALLTALRPSDVFALEADDILDGVILAGMQKRRGQPIAVPVVATLAHELEDTTGRLAPTPHAVKMTLQRLKKAPRWNGLGHLRATAATWASEAGFDDEQVAALLGHEQWTLARRHYIRRSRLVLQDPFIPLRREMLEAVEARLKDAIASNQTQ